MIADVTNNVIALAERREGERVPYASRVMIVRGESAWFAQLLDMSEGGCGVLRPDDCTLTEDEIVRLFFYQEPDAAAVVVLARVARVTDSRIGIEYYDPQAIPPSNGASP